MHQPNRPQRKRPTAGRSLAIVLIALMTALGMGAATVAAQDLTEIEAKALDDHECDATEWHFVITQVKSAEAAPEMINVTWANGEVASVPLERVTGKTAHYTTTLHLNSTVTDATTDIYPAWSGQFNLSHGPCAQGNGDKTLCPELTVTAEAGPMNLLSWTMVEGADNFKVYRAVGDGNFSVITTTDSSTLSYEDHDVVQGETYRYMVNPVIDGQEIDGCNKAEVTAIPVFPTAIVASVAGLLGISAYAVIRKRS